MPNLIKLLIVLCLSGCASQAQLTLQSLPLPDTRALPCCWQAMQHMTIKHDGSERQLTGLVARTQQQLTLVLLDSLGQRLVTIQQPDTADSELIVDQPDYVTINIPAKLLLAAIYLAHLPTQQWPQSDLANADSQPWKIERQQGLHTLYHQQQAIVSVTASQSPIPLVNETIHLQHHIKPLQVTVKTLQLQPLP